MRSATQIMSRTATGAGPGYSSRLESPMGFVGKVAGTGTVTATIKVEASADNATWFELGQIILSGTTDVADGLTPAVVVYPWVRGNVTAISGTSATATLVVCE